MLKSWHGDKIKAKLRAATLRGIDKTMSEAVIEAKQNHPGWNNRTGFAEGSISIVRFAEDRGDRCVGVWGSASCNYMIWLELKHGSALRSAADVIYPRLAGHIRDAYAGATS